MIEYEKANATGNRYMKEMRTILRMQCLLDALLADSTEEVDSKIANCQNITYYYHPNVTYLRVYSPDIPCPGICASFPYQPGTTAYEDLYYVPEVSHPCSVGCCYNGSANYIVEPFWVLGNFSSNSCPPGTSPIKESSECKSAQTYLQSTLTHTITTWKGEEVSSDWPSYCHQVTQLGAPGVWWNHHTEGTSRATARPICKDTYLPGPKAPSSRASLFCDATKMTLVEAKELCDRDSECEVVLDVTCDDSSSSWIYCQTTLPVLLGNASSQIQDACTKFKLVSEDRDALSISSVVV